MVKLLGISGSLRKGSFNTALLRAAQRVAGPDIAIEIATLDGVPLYNADDESASGIPRLCRRSRRA
jgi:NAD(P)H-dependent FMN reductase